MDDALHTARQRRSADVLGASDIHSVIVLHRAPRANHGSEGEHAVNATHGCGEHVRVANVAAEDLHTTLFEPSCVFHGKGQHTYVVAALSQHPDEVATQEAISSGDQDF